MAQKQDIENEIIATETAQAMTETFEEVSAVRMKAIRASVAQARGFLDEVNVVFHQVKLAYGQWAKKHGYAYVDGRLDMQSSLVKNGKTVRVLLSANSGLYGDLPMRVTRAFIAELEQARKGSQTEVDVVVCGKVGQYLLDHPPGGERIIATAFALSDDKPTDDEVNQIIDFLVQYDRIFVTYGHFASLLSLVPETADISGGSNEEAEVAQTATEEHDIHIIYEPSVAAVAQFFETEILKSLFWQKVYEMQLSRYASRMVAMDGATQQTKDILVHLQSESKKLDKQIANQKLQEIFAGSSIW